MTLARRLRQAAELERLARLVAESAGRDEAVGDLLAAGCRLLAADGCGLFSPEGGPPLVAAGTPPPPPAGAGEGEPVLEVALPGAEDGHSVVLVAMRQEAFDDEDAHLAAALAGLLAVARRLALQRRLLGGVLHELTTPLACVTGFTDALLAQWESLGDEARRALVERIRQHGGELSDLVGLLREHLVDVGQDPPVRQRLSLAEECAAVVALLQPLLEGREVEVDVPDVAVTADRSRLRRTLTNLLTNAAKYSPAGTPLAVRGAADGAEVHVSVVDHGVGMTSAEVSRAFDLFWRASSRDGVRGAGMGLSLARDYVRAMGGRIDVRSAPGEGSTFTVTLPAG